MPRWTRPTLLLAVMLVAACSSNPEHVDAGATPGEGDSEHDTGYDPDDLAACEEGPGAVFEQRILPLVSDGADSSCSECHAKEVNLAAFVSDDPCSSMACLAADGFVDLQNPEESKILELISRGIREDGDPTTEMARAEYDGFLQWIQWSSKCMQTSCDGPLACELPDETPLADAGSDAGTADMGVAPDTGPELPALTRANYGCSDDGLARAFYDHSFPSEGRCGHCHSPGGAIGGIGGAPMWVADGRTLEGARATIRHLFELGAVDLDNPRRSRVLLKPLTPDLGGIEHRGGSKFLSFDDPLYAGLLDWIELAASCLPDYPETEEFSDETKR